MCRSVIRQLSGVAQSAHRSGTRSIRRAPYRTRRPRLDTLRSAALLLPGISPVKRTNRRTGILAEDVDDQKRRDAERDDGADPISLRRGRRSAQLDEAESEVLAQQTSACSRPRDNARRCSSSISDRLASSSPRDRCNTQVAAACAHPWLRRCQRPDPVGRQGLPAASAQTTSRDRTFRMTAAYRLAQRKIGPEEYRDDLPGQCGRRARSHRCRK